MQIRESTDNDRDPILKVHQEAFGEPEGEAVSQLALDLLKDKTALPLLSLVAEEDNEILGHIIFTSVKVDGYEDLSIYILAPLAVSKSYQQKGLGTKLINHGLKILKKGGADLVLVYGDPNYYLRTGFGTGHNIRPPYKLEYPEAWMALELKTDMLEKVDGVAKCAASLCQPEYW